MHSVEFCIISGRQLMSWKIRMGKAGSQTKELTFSIICLPLTPNTYSPHNSAQKNSNEIVQLHRFIAHMIIIIHHHRCPSPTLPVESALHVAGSEYPWNLIPQYFQDLDLIFAEQHQYGFATLMQEDWRSRHTVYAIFTIQIFAHMLFVCGIFSRICTMSSGRQADSVSLWSLYMLSFHVTLKSWYLLFAFMWFCHSCARKG